MRPKPAPQVPAGNTGILSGLSENFAFHSSPEAFLVARIIQHHQEHSQEVRERAPVRAKILNRDIIVLSSYRQIQEVLGAARKEARGDDVPPYLAAPAYRQLMQDFFPPPNLLLQDGRTHERMQGPWKQCVHSWQSPNLRGGINRVASEFFDQMPRNLHINLYENLKQLSWKLFLSTFLDLSDSDPDFARFVMLHEDLLRGQFSLFPASVNVGFWHSPRKRAIDARKALQALISERLIERRPTWIPESSVEAPPSDEIVNHILMATSSLAVKGFASLLLALILNLFFAPHKQSGSRPLAESIKRGPPDARQSRLQAIFNETMRLSPPIVGVLRRTVRDCTVSTSNDEEPDTLIPTGFEAWCYFAGANRDPTVYGKNADLFVPERYSSTGQEVPYPLVFGGGAKSCLGAGFVSMTALTVVNALLDADVEILGGVEAAGVKAWLGHAVGQPDQWACDMKQLPTQRPSRPILVVFQNQQS